jgi:HEPN domain-containing protein
MKNSVIDERIEYWFESAKYDLKTAQSMLKEKRYLYVGFCCHLTCEKLIKAYYWKSIKSEPPFSHNLNLLIKLSNLDILITDDKQEFLDELIPLNIKARYPDDKQRISKLLDNRKAKAIYKKTNEFFLWIEKLLNQ